jgi:hypothetical protein
MTTGSESGHGWQIHLLSELVLSGTSACALIMYLNANAILLHRETNMKSVDTSVGNCCSYQHYNRIWSIKSIGKVTLFVCDIFCA